ncbi:DUF563 domain-containing protein [Halorubrum sp. Ea8]|uniref:glycosyltransferase family 61 protein n=1 Tax=Halorubrum sp. Ea8 TaxID=1383841 RepID=UPI000B98D0D9|nr:glycosyltransferase family 61 protein [Halorubrum sp. Ea8]OYR44584.1 hypothetical protein DJ74_17475 [Halorubrum sp. Ea8]
MVPKKSSAVADAAVEKIKYDGVISFVEAAANRIYYDLIVWVFHLIFGSISREKMIQQAKESGRYWEYGSSEKIEIRNDESGDVPYLFAEYAGTYDVSRPFVCELDGGLLIGGDDPLVLTRNRKLVMETEKPIFGPRKGAAQADTPFHKRTGYSDRTTSDRMRQLCGGCVQSYNRFNDVPQFESVFPICRRAPSYGHWLLDQLPKIRGLERYKEATGRDPTVIVESDPPGWIQETLSLVGVDDVIPLDMPVARANSLIVSPSRESVPRNQQVYEPSREDVDWLRREMKSRAPAPSEELPDRIYISRENLDGRGRYVTNKEELKGVLEEFDVEWCTPETLSVAEQVRLYENAEVIIGPHGAGLINMVFAREAHVIELMNKPYPMYQHLAQLCGHEFKYLRCGGEGDHSSPIEVDTTDLRDMLANTEGVAASKP